ncbi:hypothetical protein LG293_07015 [Citricoccus nitrophenolicus]
MTDDDAESRAVALRFLQTVVVVDDNAYRGDDLSDPMSASLGGEELEEASLVAPIATDDVDLDALDPLGFDTETIVERFADFGMNCAVLAPSRNEEAGDEQRLERLASRSDVVILDWVIRPRLAVEAQPSSAERTSLGLLLKVLRDDAATGGARIRLLCIYTGESDTSDILDSVQAALQEEFPHSTVVRDGFRIDIGAARVVVLRKERAVPVPGVLTVPAGELPSRVVEEFTEFVVTGLLPEIALESLTAVRDQGHRLLRRFSGEFDPALLSHRSFTSSADAEQFALSLIGSELAAIVSAAGVVTSLRDARIEAKVAAAFEGRDTAYYWKSLATNRSSQMSAANAIKALTLGVDGGGRIRESTERLDKKASRTSLMLNGDESEIRGRAKEIDLGFSALSSLARDRAFDGQRVPVPTLQLGAVLAVKPPAEPTKSDAPAEASGEDGEGSAAGTDNLSKEVDQYRYWVCLQPLCDGVRLTTATKFPMLPLQPPSEGNQKFELVVKHSDEYVPLQNSASKLSQVDLKIFSPDRDDQVVLGTWKDDEWEFTDAKGVTYVWLGNLRFDKAHKLLHNVVTTAGRIGIDEYEFLRRGYS